MASAKNDPVRPTCRAGKGACASSALTSPWAALPFAAAVLGMLVIRETPALTFSAFLSARMLGIHLVLELFAMLIAALVVTMSWHTFDRRDDRSAHALLAGFLVVVTSDLLHALTYKGMPDFLCGSGTSKAIYFWLMGRSFEVGTMALIAFNTVPRVSRNTALLLGVSASLAVVGVGCYAIEVFPVTFVDGMGVTRFKASYEYVLCGLNLVLAVQLRRRAIDEGVPQYTMLAWSSFVMGVGEIAFTSYLTPSDFQNIAGHLYKVVAYALLYKATFITSIRAPYEALRESEAELRESQVRMLTLGANIPNAVIYQLVQNLDGVKRFTQVSVAIERVNGLKVQDVMREPLVWYDQVHSEDLPALRAAERRSAETMQVFDFEARVRRTDGALRRMHLVSAPRRLDDGRIAWDGIQTDVTERSDAREARRVLEAQLCEAQKMESIGTLASGIAHDFNNVLGSIIGNTAMAREDVARGFDKDALRSLDQVCTAAMRARELVRQILTFSRKQGLQRTAQAIRPIVEESLALLRATLPANVNVAVVFDEPRVQARVDGIQVEQVLLNLCTNAWHAMDGRGGRIEVGLRMASMQGDAAVAAGLVPGAYAHLWVEDNGCGMDETTRQRAFEPFFTTKPVGTGTGLGLSVVHGIVKSHDGGVVLNSSPGRGTRFDIYLPSSASDPPAEQTCHAKAPAASEPGHGEHIVYVDDDDVMSLMVERLLQRAGYTVTCLHSPAEAIYCLVKDPDAFQLLVTDYNMPTLSGLDVIRDLARAGHGFSTVLISGDVSDELRANAHELGVFDVLEKQYAFEELVPTVKRALASRPARGRTGAERRSVR